jgi:hypothetical protein
MSGEVAGGGKGRFGKWGAEGTCLELLKHTQHTHIRTHTHIHTDTHIHADTHIHTDTHIHADTHIDTH